MGHRSNSTFARAEIVKLAKIGPTRAGRALGVYQLVTCLNDPTNHLRYACCGRDYGSKKHCGSRLKLPF